MRSIFPFIAFFFSLSTAAQSVEVMFIVDASNAMAQPFAKGTRLETVKTVLSDEIQALPAGIKAGLSLFGHRSNTDCRDVEIAIRPGSEDRAGIVRELRETLPIGKSLTARALETSCIPLARQEAHSVVILIGAGGDECGGAPCASTKSLMTRGLNMELHIVGLAPTAADEAELQCAAEVGKGTYTRATNADELRKAIATLRARLPVIARQQPPVHSGEGWLHLTFDEAALASVGRIDVTDLQTGNVVKALNNTPPSTVLSLPPSRYGVRFTYLALGNHPPFSVEAGTFDIQNGQHAEVRYGMLKIVLANRPALAALKGFRIIPRGKSTPLITLDPALALVPRPLPVGQYDIWLDYADTRPSVKLASDAAFGQGGGVIIELDDLLRKEAP